MMTLRKSSKMADICYDIRGPVLAAAQRLQEQGQQILKLHIGNPASFDFFAPDEIIQDVIHNLPDSQGYCDAKGIYSARKAVMQYYQQQQVAGITIEDIFLGNGVSELIQMALQALINNQDEILIPSPDFPIWTGATRLAGGRPVHYHCDEQAGWLPDIADIKAKITKHTRAIVIINPNNPTGAVYPKALLDDIVVLARKHQLVILADEIYDRIVFPGAQHYSIASLAEDLLCITFSGLSKTYRIPGFRVGWMVISGAKQHARDYIEGLTILASMRLCANVPGQYAIQTALGGLQSIDQLICADGRLNQQRELAWQQLNQIDGVSCQKPAAALYLFPRLDPKIYPVHNDERLVLDLLNQEKILIVQGSAFNWPTPDHVRLVFLPTADVLTDGIQRIANFLQDYRQ
jgi:alanine-synthesizing transaminase